MGWFTGNKIKPTCMGWAWQYVLKMKNPEKVRIVLTKVTWRNKWNENCFILYQINGSFVERWIPNSHPVLSLGQR